MLFFRLILMIITQLLEEATDTQKEYLCPVTELVSALLKLSAK